MRVFTLLPLVFLLISHSGWGQRRATHESPDTLVVRKGLQVVLADTAFIAQKDTVIIVPAGKGRIRENPYAKTERFYDTLAQKAEGRRVTRELHEFLVRTSAQVPRVDSAIIKSEEAFKRYAGKKIRSIGIKKADLLEGSVMDTTMVATSRIGKAVNRLHTDTRDFIVRNNLLFAVGDLVDPYKLADNERVLRQFKTIRDARIYLKPVPGLPDEVDVVVVTQDVASVGATGDYSSLDKFSLDVYDINILGYAKQFQVSYFRNTDGSPVHGYELSLREPNFGSSFISGELKYTDNYLRNRISLTIGRDVLTPQMKYAGGVELFRTRENYLTVNDTIPKPYAKENIDVWVGRSFQMATRTNLVVSVRNHDYRFTDRPAVKSDSNYFFHNRNALLASATVYQNNYVKGSLIRGFGRTEDVPVSGWVGATFGQEYTEFGNRNYLDLRAGKGLYIKKAGYFSGTVTVGGFITPQRWEDGVVKFSGMYFSNLLHPGRTKIRQFVNFGTSTGYNRTTVPYLGIPGRWRDGYGFVPIGVGRVMMGAETVYFTPWYYYGFKFALYHGVDLHLLKAPETGDGTWFTGVRAGVRMLNDNLVFPTLSVGVAYYAKTKEYPSSFSIKFSTSLPRLFGAPQSFKPEIASLD